MLEQSNTAVNAFRGKQADNPLISMLAKPVKIKRIVPLDEGISIPRYIKRQVLVLSIIPPTRSMMKAEGNKIPRAVDRCWERLLEQSRKLFTYVPAYNEKTLRQLNRIVSEVWNSQNAHGYNYITMLNTALYIIESCRIGARKAKSPTAVYLDRMAGTMFTLIKHVDTPYWHNPDEAEQILGEKLGLLVMERL